jgi:outer membrane lipoprotein-sorting protein
VKKTLYKYIVLISSLSLLYLPTLANTKELLLSNNLTPEEKGLAIANKVEENYDNFVDSSVEIDLVVQKGNGTPQIRQIKTNVLDTPDGDRLLLELKSPADVMGMVFLIFSQKFKEDDIWIYIPDLRRVRRGSSQNKGSSFLGSEWNREDFNRSEPEKFTYRYIRDEDFSGQSCYLVERYPVEKNSQYSREIMWIDKKEFRILKVDWFNQKDIHVKTLLYNDYKLYDEKFWRPDEQVMLNHVNGEKSRSIYKDWKFDTGLNKRLFTVNGLKSIR